MFLRHPLSHGGAAGALGGEMPRRRGKAIQLATKMAECGLLRSGPRVNQSKRDPHMFLSGAALPQNKQEPDEGFQPRQESWQQEKDPNSVLSPYSVWRPSRLFQPVSDEDMKEFKTSYQSLKGANQLPRGGGGAIAMHTFPDLGRKTQEACESLDSSGRLKEQVPEVADPDRLEIKRQHFRHFCYQEIEGPRAVLRKLQELCCQWLVPERHTKEQIVDLVILEQFLTILPLEMQIWVCKSGPATCAQALALAESFLLRLQEAENHAPKERLEKLQFACGVRELAIFNDVAQGMPGCVTILWEAFLMSLHGKLELADGSSLHSPDLTTDLLGIGLMEEAFVNSPAPKQDLPDAVEICISEVEEEATILMGGEVCSRQLGMKVPAAVRSADASPIVVEVQLPEDSGEQRSVAPAPRRKVPWSGFEKAFTYVRQRGKNLVVQCNFCLPAYKTVSAAITSSSNLKKHLERAHPEKLKIIESAKRVRRRGYSVELRHDDETPALKMPKQQPESQAGPEKWGCGKETVTQRILDKKIMDFIVEETLPFETVDRSSFIGLVRLGLPKGLSIMCANTLRDRIQKRAASMRETLVSRMGVVSHVATTADCWTIGKRSFLGVMAHWISPTTLKREFGALAYKRLKGHLTYSVLVKALHDVHIQYQIHSKVVCTTTDNGSNFVQMFRGFRTEELRDATETSIEGNDKEGDGDDQEEPEVTFVPISEILDTSNKAAEERVGSKDFSLPPLQRCVSHSLNLVATQDVEALISDSSKNSLHGPFWRHFRSLMEKCNKLWSKHKGSKQFTEYVREQCGVYLKVPNQTQWNVTFDALKQLNELLSNMPLKVGAVTDQCSMARFTPAESIVLQEYTEIMWPLAQSLDILQRENGMFMGYLLPTLHNLDRKLQGLENKPVKYTYCLPLLRGIREALRKRFAGIWEDKKLLLAACLHPRFKVDWLDSAQAAQINRYMMEALVKAEIRGTVSEENDRSSEKDQESDSLEDDFFNIRPRGRKSAVDSADEEVWDYLKCPSWEVSSLHAFPRIMQSFLQYNTGMPSSAAAERLFCTEDRGATAKRHSLSDEVFEQLVLLRQNRALF